jgi:hypothetical protein
MALLECHYLSSSFGSVELLYNVQKEILEEEKYGTVYFYSYFSV